MILTGCVESQHRKNTITFLYCFMLSNTAIMSTYINYVSKDAMIFLHYNNAYSILALGVFVVFAVDSPFKELSNGNEE